MAGIDPKFERLLRGLNCSDDAQEPPGKDGDPQIAALLQFLQGQHDVVSHEDVILDIGSGRGILAHQMLKVWPEDPERPWYYAADQLAGLEHLAVPPSIHNHSAKLSLEDLAALSTDKLAARVKIVVIRNVFHHLHIADMASMLLLLRAFTSQGSTVYVQDMGTLATLERHNTGWPSEILGDLLKNFGFALPGAFDLKGRSGTPWYGFTLKEAPEVSTPTAAEAAHLVVEARREQLQRAIVQQRALGEADEAAVDYLALSEQIAVLNLQLHEFDEAEGEGGPALQVAGLPLRPLAPAAEYADEVNTSPSRASGLKAILSSKTLINLPALIDSATARLWFAGYSQRLLFSPGPVRVSLANAVSRGVNVRVLIVDPSTDAARARGRSETYSTPIELIGDIVETIEGYRSFAAELTAKRPQSLGEIELRLCETIISSSFFFVDGTCICSLYSFNLRGGTAPAFVLRGQAEASNDYFSLLLREFQSVWLQSVAPSPEAA